MLVVYGLVFGFRRCRVDGDSDDDIAMHVVEFLLSAQYSVAGVVGQIFCYRHLVEE
jgi:hypothetical protein